ncbi:MAG: hypothetical protein AB7I19_05620 [Planctomycetota bacterium]
MAALLSVADLTAQGAPVDRVFNIHVDPVNGDNAQATALNPSFNPGAVRPLDTHPQFFAGIQGFVQHAPYTFKTLSGPNGAIQYAIGLGADQPMASRFVNNGQRLAFFVIHCLPGLYGPRRTDMGVEEFDAASGLPWNGEVFPIEMPQAVSIQGTSALDTIFDARGYENPGLLPFGHQQTAFWFRSPLGFPFGGRDYSRSFIDSVSIRGCRGGANSSIFGAGVLIGEVRDNQPRCSPRLTNCFLYANWVGIAVWCNGLSGANLHRPQIVNNTLAWNQCGIYMSNSLGEGWAEPIIHNNLIDRVAPIGPGLPPWLTGIAIPGSVPSCMEGVRGEDLLVAVAGALPGCGGGTGLNCNGYDPAGVNTTLFGYGPAGALPRGFAAGVSTQFQAPIVDLSTWTGSYTTSGVPTQTRGAFFVNDVLRLAGKNAAPHDFRLAPTVRRAADSTFFEATPAVNTGLSLANGAWRFTNVLTIPGGVPQFGVQVISAPPGLGSDHDAVFHGFDWDCEGFGNPREAARRNGQTATFGSRCLSTIDLGADELGELIISGYLDGTRILSRPHASIAPNTATIQNNERMYFLNIAIPGISYIAPQFNLRHDEAPMLPPGYSGSGPNWARPEWFAQLGEWHNPFRAGSDPALPFAYTSGQHDAIAGSLFDVTVRHGLVDPLWTLGFSPYPHFPRTRVSDIGPHLLDDIAVGPIMVGRAVDYSEFSFIHPFLPLTRKDAFQVNAWYSQVDPASAPNVNDNSLHYVRAATGGATSNLRQGTVNPPLTIFADPAQGAFPSSFLFRAAPAHPIGFWGSPTFMYQVGSDGLSVGFSAVTIPAQDYYGYRQNFEIFDPDSTLWQSTFGVRPVNNLQTILVVQGDVLDPENEMPISNLGSSELERRAELVRETLRLEGARRRR